MGGAGQEAGGGLCGIGQWRGSTTCTTPAPPPPTHSHPPGKPLWGTLIALLHRGQPVLGLIDQPVTRERWVGAAGRPTTLNGAPAAVRACPSVADAYLYATTPHMFAGRAEAAWGRVRDAARVPLYGCDCYAYGLLASGHVDLVVEADLQPYDYLALVPIVTGAGGVMTDWKAGGREGWQGRVLAGGRGVGERGAGGRGGGGGAASIARPPARLTPPCFPSHPPRATPWLRPTASRAGTAWPACRGRSSPPEMRARTPPHWACWRGEGREEWEGRGEGWERCEWWPQARAASDSGRGRHEPVYLSRRAAPVRLPARRAPPFMAPLTLDTLRKASSQGPAC